MKDSIVRWPFNPEAGRNWAQDRIAHNHFAQRFRQLFRPVAFDPVIDIGELFGSHLACQASKAIWTIGVRR